MEHSTAKDALQTLQKLCLIAGTAILIWLISYITVSERFENVNAAEDLDQWLGLKAFANNVNDVIADRCPKDNSVHCIFNYLINLEYPVVHQSTYTFSIDQKVPQTTKAGLLPQKHWQSGTLADFGRPRFVIYARNKYSLTEFEGSYELVLIPGGKSPGDSRSHWIVVPHGRESEDKGRPQETGSDSLAPFMYSRLDWDGRDQDDALVQKFFADTLANQKGESNKLLGISVGIRTWFFGIGFVLFGIAVWMAPSLFVLIDVNRQGKQTPCLWVMAAPKRSGHLGEYVELVVEGISLVFCLSPLAIIVMQQYIYSQIPFALQNLFLRFPSYAGCLLAFLTFLRVSIELKKYRNATVAEPNISSTDKSSAYQA